MTDRKSELEKQADEILRKAGFKPDLPEGDEISIDELEGKGVELPDSKIPPPHKAAENKLKDQLIYGANVLSIAECQKILSEFKELVFNHPRRAVFRQMFWKPVKFVYLWQFLFSCGVLRFVSTIIQNPVDVGLVTEEEALSLELAIVSRALLNKGIMKNEVAEEFIPKLFPNIGTPNARVKKLTQILDEYDSNYKKFNCIFPMEFNEGDVINEAIYPLIESMSYNALKGKYDDIVMKDIIVKGKEAHERAERDAQEFDKRLK
jgi:hypothetical protein